MPPLVLGPRCNRRVTCDWSPSNDRSESALAVNPTDPLNMVGSSKRFTDPHTYAFSLAAYATFDGGLSWTESPLTLVAGADFTSDPTVTFDDVGNAYLLGLVWSGGPSASATNFLGLAAYKSSDGGRTWSAPNYFYAQFVDKQWAAGDPTPGSPHHGNVYVTWDGRTSAGSGIVFARTLDHGATWVGVKQGSTVQPAGSLIAAGGEFSSLAVASDGTVFVFFMEDVSGQRDVRFVKSTNGGDTFSAPATVATGITEVPSHLPGGTFRLESIPSSCCGTGHNVVVAWPDYRDGSARIYYRHSGNAGGGWSGPANGQLLTSAVPTAAGQHDFMPQLASTPNGEIGCAFYELGPKSGGSMPLIDVVLAVSTNSGGGFSDRVTVTDTPWDPAVDAPWASGDPATTFIGDYFGFAASRLGFFPFWTDTRTGVQEIFTARVAVRPADVYIRDSSTDVGGVPSPGFHWEAPDLVVRRQQDGATTFVNEDLERDGVTDHYVYGRVHNLGPNPATNVTLAVTVGNYPSLHGLPGSEFRYPEDWYPGDWVGNQQGNHLYLGESAPIASLAVSADRIIGPVRWPAASIPLEGTWHPCLLAEVRADNDDSAGGVNGCAIEVSPGTCDYGAYFWGSNNICQRNLSYAHPPWKLGQWIALPFVVGSAWSEAGEVTVIVERSPELAELAIVLVMRRLPRDQPDPDPGKPAGAPLRGVVVHGGRAVKGGWRLTDRRAAITFPTPGGTRHQGVLRFRVADPQALRNGGLIRVLQRDARGVVTGSISLELTNPESVKPG